jgi:hypothetical protein
MTAIPEAVLTKQEKKARKAPILLTATETGHVAGGAPRSGQGRATGKASDSMGGNGQGAAHSNAHDRFLPA